MKVIVVVCAIVAAFKFAADWKIMLAMAIN